LPAGARIFPLTSVFRPALGPTQPPVQWVPWVLSLGVKRGRGVKLTTHPHLVPSSRISRSCISSPPSAFMARSRTALLFTFLLSLPQCPGLFCVPPNIPSNLYHGQSLEIKRPYVSICRGASLNTMGEPYHDLYVVYSALLEKNS
jgi:hypothetical protein